MLNNASGSNIFKGISHMRLKGNRRCPFCRKPLAFLYEDASSGHMELKCGNCGHRSVVDLKTAEVYPKEKISIYSV